MVLHAVAGQRHELDAPLLEVDGQLLHAPQLGGADGRVVGRVGEEDGPRLPDPVVPADVALRRVGLEVRDLVAQLEGHGGGGGGGGGGWGQARQKKTKHATRLVESE